MRHVTLYLIFFLFSSKLFALDCTKDKFESINLTICKVSILTDDVRLYLQTKDGEPFMSFGVMGGATQPQAHAQIIINMIDFGLNLQEAGDAPRIVHSGSSQPTDEVMIDGGTLSIETGFGVEIEEQLAKKGHILKYERGIFGGYQAIMLKDGVYFGASETRKDGQAAGY